LKRIILAVAGAAVIYFLPPALRHMGVSYDK
jgi:hypothetical protein